MSDLTLASLASAPHWVAWQQQNRKGGKPTKVPYVTPDQQAQANAPSWITRPAAQEVADALPKPYGLGGVGIEFTSLGDGRSTFGVDLDTCRIPDSEELATWATDVIGTLNSYTEVSPSRTGVKIFATYDTAALTDFRRNMGTAMWSKSFSQSGGEHPPAIELHLGNRYFAVTDLILSGSTPVLRHVEASAISQVLTKLGPAFAGASKPESTKPARNDQSRSAVAMRKGMQLVRSGCDYAAMVTGLQLDPDTADWTQDKGRANGARELKRIYEKAEASVQISDVDLTEDGIALAFTRQHADELRYCHDTGAWFQYEAARWRQDQTKLAYSWARQTCRVIAASAAENKRATLAKAATAGAVERFAQADPALAVTAKIWDADPFLLGTPAGTVDLRTAVMHPGNPADYITKQTAVSPAETPHAPLWDAFLLEATDGDTELIRFLRQWFGYCLTGDTREHALLFGFGPGGNGKSVLLNTVAGIMGDYCRQAAMETFTASSGDKHPTDLAMLRGARMVCASETEEGRAWAETRIKALTGGDVIAARFMRQDFFEYRPQFKLVVIGNHKPVLRNVDEAARRRFNVVPFVHTPTKPDRDLEAKLRAEWPGILRWMIEGCLDWQKHGLVRPKVVKDATAEYFEAQDFFARWLNECAKLAPTLESKPAILLASFRDWCAANGEPMTDNTKMRGMIERTAGLKYVKTNGTRYVRGIGLNPPTSTLERGQYTD